MLSFSQCMQCERAPHLPCATAGSAGSSLALHARDPCRACGTHGIEIEAIERKTCEGTTKGTKEREK